MFIWRWNNNEILLAYKTQPIVGKPLIQKSATSVLLSWYGYVVLPQKEQSEPLPTDMHLKFGIEIT